MLLLVSTILIALLSDPCFTFHSHQTASFKELVFSDSSSVRNTETMPPLKMMYVALTLSLSLPY